MISTPPPQRLNLSYKEPETFSNSQFPITYSQTREKSQDSSSLTDLNSGVFTVDKTGKVLIEYLLDGSGNKGELAIFSLEGIEELAVTNYEEFLKEASRRALTNSELGYVVISDREEAALYQENPGPKNRNGGDYKGLKILEMKPEDKVGFLFVPNSTVEKVFEKPKITGAKRPFFSLTTENADDNFPESQFVDLTGDGEVFAFDGSRSGQKDYKDVVFAVSMLEGKVPLYDDLINPKPDWFEEKTDFVEVVDRVIDEDRDAPEITVELVNDTGEDETDKMTADPSLTGTVIDGSEIVSFELSFTGESESFVEVTAELESDGNFVLEREVLEEVLGETLPLGMNAIYLRATDEKGWDSAVFEFQFTLEEEDLLGPEIESLAGISGLDAYPDAITLPPSWYSTAIGKN